MSGLPHVEQVKSHFISGEPGTTGREPFEESIATGKFLPERLEASTDRAPHIPAGTHVGGAPVGAGIDGLGHSSTSNTHTTGAHGEKKGLVEKVKEALPPHHDNNTSTHGTHGTSTHGTHGTSTHGTSTHDSTHGEKKGLVEKVKEALPVGGHKDHSSSTTTHGTSSSTHGTHGTHGAGIAGANSSNSGTTDAVYKRDIVDKLNDALPGTPAKVPQAYEYNAGDVSTGTTGTAYGAGKHAGAGEGIHPGVGGVVSGGHGVAGTHNDPRMVDRAPESLEHQNEPKKGGLSGLLATSDKDFIGRDRKGEGAYADTHGVTQLNQSGPKGNPALTGREGTLENNPVYQAKSRDVGHSDTTTATGEKKSIVEKIKDKL